MDSCNYQFFDQRATRIVVLTMFLTTVIWIFALTVLLTGQPLVFHEVDIRMVVDNPQSAGEINKTSDTLDRSLKSS